MVLNKIWVQVYRILELFLAFHLQYQKKNLKIQVWKMALYAAGNLKRRKKLNLTWKRKKSNFVWKVCSTQFGLRKKIDLMLWKCVLRSLDLEKNWFDALKMCSTQFGLRKKLKEIKIEEKFVFFFALKKMFLTLFDTLTWR